MSLPSMLKRPIPAWFALVAILVTASVSTLLFWGPNLLIPRPDFQVQPNSSSQTILAGCHSGQGTFTVSHCTNGSESKILVKSLNGFTGIVTLTVATPANVNATIIGYNTNPVAILGPNDTVWLDISAGLAGNYTVAITGTSGQLSHTVNVSIIAEDMTFQDSSNSLVVPQGSRANMTITMKGVNGLYGNLTLTGGGDSVHFYSPAANCTTDFCTGNPPPYPLARGGMVEVIVMAPGKLFTAARRSPGR
jgi:hypothetical protein